MTRGAGGAVQHRILIAATAMLAAPRLCSCRLNAFWRRLRRATAAPSRRPRSNLTGRAPARTATPAFDAGARPIAKARAGKPATSLPPRRNGPLQIIVSLDKQQLTLYSGGEVIAHSRVSTGQRGHSTPTGVFSIIQKDRWHRSNIYDDAPMYFMQRITWSGVALHQGVVPNYPASHGCIRLPEAFAKQMWTHDEDRRARDRLAWRGRAGRVSRIRSCSRRSRAAGRRARRPRCNSVRRRRAGLEASRSSHSHDAVWPGDDDRRAAASLPALTMPSSARRRSSPARCRCSSAARKASCSCARASSRCSTCRSTIDQPRAAARHPRVHRDRSDDDDEQRALDGGHDEPEAHRRRAALDRITIPQEARRAHLRADDDRRLAHRSPITASAARPARAPTSSSPIPDANSSSKTHFIFQFVIAELCPGDLA